MTENGLIYDMLVVLLYFVVILTAGVIVSRRHREDSARDFMTGGRTLNWVRTGLALVAMSIDTGIMGVAGIGFVWGLTIHPNAVNFWITAPVAAMFLIPIYWRTKIVTTPELLEKRFNSSNRALFSALMTLMNIIVLGTSIYLGGLILLMIFNWNLFISCAVIMGIVGLYVLMGGMKTVLSINIYQAVFITLALLTVGIVCVVKVGGLWEFLHLPTLNKIGHPMPSTLLPVDLSIRSQSWYAFPAGLVWAALGGTAWIACNFNMAQRLLAAKNERHAQKAMLFTGTGATVLFFTAYVIGVCVNWLEPELEADKSYVYAILNLFPAGIRGLMIAGLIASLISTIDGLLTASGTLVTQDIYLRFIRPEAADHRIKRFSRVVQAAALAIAFLLIPLSAKEETVTRLIQDLVSIPLGVIIAVFLLAVFSTRATPWATFAGALSGTILMIFIYFAFPDINFMNRGIFGFFTVLLVASLLSRFEKAPAREDLKNLTVFTLEGVPGPWVGQYSWGNLWKWIAGMVIGWFGFTALWEWMIRV